MTGAEDRHPYLRRDLPLAMAHRGDRFRFPPGNSWAAFESAVELGFRYLETDASDDSRPILERLGFRAVTTTTPYVWSP